MGCGIPPGGCQGDEVQTRKHDQNPNIFGPKVAHEHSESFASGADHFILPTETSQGLGAENGLWGAPW